MSKLKLREEKNCLNCGTEVTDRFCPHCGQENIINRPSFSYLFKEFFNSLVHFDGHFWTTIRVLLFKPGFLVNNYLEGKRKSFVPPVKLYIFVSLVAFLLPGLPSGSTDSGENEGYTINIGEDSDQDAGDSINPKDIESLALLDSIQNALPADKKIDPKTIEYINERISHPEKKDSLDKAYAEYVEDFNASKSLIYFDNYPEYKAAKTIREFDSIHNSLPKSKRMGWMMLPFYKKGIELNENKEMTNDEFARRFQESFVHNFPRVLIFYLPVFAFVLWVFHGKKKWKFYDHGIFTLYFFSFLLMLISLWILIDRLLSIPEIWFPNFAKVSGFITALLMVACVFYSIFYFFRSHSRIYKESKLVSRLKSFLILSVNIWLFFFMLLGFTILTFLMM
ncbi:MAG: DUF3667 domain-containing protein [Flavobacteriia bacterium]|nr:DUF3667 domain-containing protein [Flavobacteriia bacterium]